MSHDERQNLLQQLRIDRADPVQRDSGSAWFWVAGCAVILLGLAGYGWFAFAAGNTVTVTIATAAAVDSNAAPQRDSILDASGYVVARRQATVASKITGRVMDVLIEEGQRVKRNQVVARLEDGNERAALAYADAQRTQAMASLEAARVAVEDEAPTFERYAAQFARRLISAQDFDNAKAAHDVARMTLAVAQRAVGVSESVLTIAQRNLEDTVVRAPFDGVVTVKAAQEGEMVSPNSAGGGFTRTGIGTIVDMDSLEIEVDVSENFINRVKPDQSSSIKLNAYPDWDVPGHVIAIVPTADRAKGTVRVRIAFDELNEKVMPEMGVRVSFLTAADRNQSAQSGAGVVVPPDAIQANGQTGIVFVQRNDRVERRVVRLGTRIAAGQIVLSGLSSGERLVIGDPALLTSGAKIRVSE